VPSRDTIDRLRSFDSLSSTLTIRSKICGGGPSIDSNATVGPLPPAMAKAPLPAPAPSLTQPPSPHANPSSVTARPARGAVRAPAAARNRVAMVSFIAPSDIVKMC
jgi:hypothetical protein